MLFKATSAPFTTSLDIGLYRIFVLGGFDVQTTPNFALEIAHINTGKVMPITRKSLGIRDYKRGRRAVHSFDLSVDFTGEYQISIRHPEGLQVRRSMLFILHFIEGNIPTFQVEILIERITL